MHCAKCRKNIDNEMNYEHHGLIYCHKCHLGHIETRRDIEKHTKPIEKKLKEIAGF